METRADSTKLIAVGVLCLILFSLLVIKIIATPEKSTVTDDVSRYFIGLVIGGVIVAGYIYLYKQKGEIDIAFVISEIKSYTAKSGGGNCIYDDYNNVIFGTIKNTWVVFFKDIRRSFIYDDVKRAIVGSSDLDYYSLMNSIETSELQRGIINSNNTGSKELIERVMKENGFDPKKSEEVMQNIKDKIGST